MTAAAALVFVESNTSGTGALFARVAHELGLEPVLVTDRPERYRFLETERVRVAEVADSSSVPELREAAEALAATAPLAGVTSSSEYSIADAAELASRLGLPGPDPEAVRLCRDKALQRQRLAAAGVAIPRFRDADTVLEAVTAAADLGSRVVVKPVAESGSVGVALCDGPAEVREHARTLLAATTDARGRPREPRVVVEELVEGPELSVELFDRRPIAVVRKHLGPLPRFVEVGHDLPAPLPDERRRAVERTAVAALDALGLDFGPAHVELRLADGVPTIIEVNPRLAGGFIPELVRRARGIDLVRATVERVAGRRPRPEADRRRAASIRFLLAPAAGVFAGATGLEAARALPGVDEVLLYREPGDELRLGGDFNDRIGHVITTADGADGADEAARRAVAARDRVRLEVAPAAAAAG